MENFKLKSSTHLNRKAVGILTLVLAVFTLSSCLKTKNDDIQQNASALAVINASPDLDKFDFVIDNNLVNSGSFSFSERLAYQNIYSGQRRIAIYKDETRDTIRTGTLTAQAGKIYSVYVVGPGVKPEFLIVKDSLSAPTAGKAHIRFINLSLNSPELKLNYGVGGDSTLFSNVKYKKDTKFVEVAGGKKYNFTTSESSGASTVPVGAQNSVMIESGKIYTVWAKGYYDMLDTGADSLKLGLKVQLNN